MLERCGLASRSGRDRFRTGVGEEPRASVHDVQRNCGEARLENAEVGLAYIDGARTVGEGAEMCVTVVWRV